MLLCQPTSLFPAWEKQAEARLIIPIYQSCLFLFHGKTPKGGIFYAPKEQTQDRTAQTRSVYP